MQGKGFVKFLLIALTAVCVLQYIYMIPTYNVEKDAEAHAESLVSNLPEGSLERISKQRAYNAEYLDSMSSEEIFSIPLLKDFTYDELKQQNLALGLDLKGGMSVALQVNMRDLISEMSGNIKDPTFVQALDNANVALKSSQSDFVTLFAQEFGKIADGKKLARLFLGKNSKIRDDLTADATDGDVARILRDKTSDVVTLTFNRLKQRIDKLGVAQPNVSLDAARDIILVELPGIDNPERARKFLSASAQLEFWDVWNMNDPGIAPAFQQADQLLKTKFALNDDPVAIKYDTTYVPDSLGNLTNEILSINEAAPDPLSNLGPLLSVFSPSPAVQTATMGTANKNQRDTISAMLKMPEVAALFPKNGKFLWAAKPIADQTTGLATPNYELYFVKMLPGSEKPKIEGDVITSASSSPDPLTGQIQVTMAMDSRGAAAWAQMTTAASQDNNRQLAIALDDEIQSAPRSNEPITGGRTAISGNFSIAEASDLASILEVGKLPAKVDIIQSNTVGPSLGKQNIERSFKSLIFGLIIVLIFMVLYYGGAGLVSIIALIANMFFIFGALASIGTVLTIPGFAGIVLTIGMAVDANVIIFERVREELRSGKSMLQAIQDGFNNSYSAIIDANVTTILVAIILAWFGLGPIKGFAVVLIIGVLSSLFTAVLLGKLMIDWWTQSKGKEMTFWTGWSKNVFANLNIDWIGKRKIAYVISGTIIVLGIISMATRGFDLGVDFTGGYSYNVKFEQGVDVSAQQLRETLTAPFGGEPVVKSVDVANTYQIVTSYLIDDTDEDASKKVLAKLHEGINGIVGGGLSLADFENSDNVNGTYISATSKVGPTIADDISSDSKYAGIFALLAIFLYILIRFNKWQFSLGAVAALFHDSLIVLGLFSIFWDRIPGLALEIDQVFVGALLTVIGYSINDTVVVFDRIREYLGIYTNKSTDEVLNLAINSTFSRTIVTSLTTLFVVLILLIFGGGNIKGFAFAMIIGVVVGTYSSIFVATPIVRDFSNELRGRKKQETKKHFSKAITS